MAVEQKKKVGFLTPQLDNQRNQGGQSSGGGANNTNNAGNVGVQDNTRRLSPLKQGLTTLGSTLVQGAQDFGNRLSSVESIIAESVNKRQGVLDTLKQNTSSTSTPQPIIQQVSNQPQSNTTSVTTAPASQPQITVPTESQALGKFNKVGVESGNFGQSGKIQYTLDDQGVPIRTDTTTGTSSRLGGISSIGPNGSTVSRALRPEEQETMARSKQMVADWQDYKDQRASEQNRNMMLSAISQMPPATQKSALLKLGLGSMAEQGDTARTQMTTGASLASAAGKQQLEARKSIFEEGRDTAEYARKVQEDSFNRDLNTQKLIQEDQKVLADPISTLSKLKTLGKLNSTSAKAVLGNELSGLNDKQQVSTKLGELNIPSDLAAEILIDYE